MKVTRLGPKSQLSHSSNYGFCCGVVLVQVATKKGHWTKTDSEQELEKFAVVSALENSMEMRMLQCKLLLGRS